MTSTAGAADPTTVTFDMLYQRQWWPMVRLATGLVDEVRAAEDVVQDAFAALFRRWETLRAPQAAVGYLRIAVVNGSRSALRRRRTATRHLRAVSVPDADPADRSSVLSAEYEVVRAALGRLPERQREVLTLRYLADIDDAEIAAATGLSVSGVRSASSRGLATLRTQLGELL